MQIKELLKLRKAKLTHIKNNQQNSYVEVRHIPKEKRYSSMKMKGSHNIPFESQLSRKENIHTETPFPGQERFQAPKMFESKVQVPPLKMDVLSKNLRTLTGPAMSSMSNRVTEFEKVDNRPSISHYQTQKYLEALDLKESKTGIGAGSLNFSKRPEKQFHAPPKPFQIPESKELVEIENAEKSSGQIKRIKGLVDINKTIARDDHVHFNFNNKFTSMEDLRIWKSVKTRNHLRFGSTLPQKV